MFGGSCGNVTRVGNLTIGLSFLEGGDTHGFLEPGEEGRSERIRGALSWFVLACVNFIEA